MITGAKIAMVMHHVTTTAAVTARQGTRKDRKTGTVHNKVGAAPIETQR
jgi:hypothetical protein